MKSSPFWCAALCAVPLMSAAADQAYPTRPVRIIATLSAGSQVDILARLLGQKLGEAWGQQFVVDNRPGAGGVIATGLAANALPDGYTLLMVAPGHAINATLYAKLPYDTLKDFAGVSLVARVPSVLVVSPTLGAKTVKDLIALAKQKPGALNFASPGVGSGGHLAAEQFKLSAGIDLVHVPYKGTPEALTDVISGRAQLFFAPLGAVVSLVKDGKVPALAVTTAKRSPALPDLPTVAEAALPGFELDFWYGLLAPRATPRPILDQLAQEIRQILEQKDVRERLISQGAVPDPVPTQKFDAFLKNEVARMAVLVKASGAKAE